MKRYIHGLVLSLLLLSFCNSCIKDEPLFKEADIVKISLEDDIEGDVIYQTNIISILVYDTTGFAKKKITPKIEVSEGAHIYPQSGEPVVLDNYNAIYEVFSEDKSTSKKYIVQVVPFESLKYDFEDWQTVNFIGKIYEKLSDPLWMSGNEGIRIIYDKGKNFPTRSTDDKRSGEHAALLETLFGKPNLKAPLFAGSLYRGILELNLSDPAKSAKFGQMFPKYFGKPIRFKGHYKYKPGETFVDENQQAVPNKIDECDIYAVLFKVTKGPAGKNEYLDATNVKTDPSVIAIAQLADLSAKSEYTEFNIPFVYKEDFDYDNNDYKLVISFTSSREGAFYRGAIGSTLIVDDVEVVCKQ